MLNFYEAPQNNRPKVYSPPLPAYFKEPQEVYYMVYYKGS